MDLIALFEQCSPQVAPTTMQRIIFVESHGNPNVIGYKITKKGKVYTLTKQPENKEQAVAWATWLYSNNYRFDAGIAQVNSQNFASFNVTPESIFDPCVNVRVGGQILTQFYQSAQKQYKNEQKALLAAVSAYNSGNFSTGFKNGYVSKFIHHSFSFPMINYAWNQPPLKAIPQSVIDKNKVVLERKVVNKEELNPYTASSEVEAFKNI